MLKPTTKSKTGKAIRKNGRIYRNRICIECGKKHFHAENICIKCRNTMYKKTGKYAYIKLKYGPGEMERQKRLAEHTERIASEMTAIRNAGLCPIKDSVQAIMDAGVPLDGSFDQLPRCLASPKSSQYSNTTVVSEETNALHLIQNSSSRENKRVG